MIADRHDHLKIAVFAAAKIALDNSARAVDVRGDPLALPPRQAHVRIVMPKVPQINRAPRCDNRHDHLEIAVTAACENRSG